MRKVAESLWVPNMNTRMGVPLKVKDHEIPFGSLYAELGYFSISIPERWDLHFFPNNNTKLRLVKDQCALLVEHFLVPSKDSSDIIDSFFEDHSLALRRKINGAIFDLEDELEYEVLAEEDGKFSRYFFYAAGRFIFRLILSGDWEPNDEDEIRTMLRRLKLNREIDMVTEEVILVPFEFEYKNWFRVGAMYSLRGGL